MRKGSCLPVLIALTGPCSLRRDATGGAETLRAGRPRFEFRHRAADHQDQRDSRAAGECYRPIRPRRAQDRHHQRARRALNRRLNEAQHSRE